MKPVAYLLLWIDPKPSPPVVVSAGIYGERCPSNRQVLYPVLLAVRQADTYQEASDALLAQIESSEHMKWVVPLLGPK